MKSKFMPTAVLGIICLVSALLLALINIPTEAKIREDQRKKEMAALIEVLPGSEDFEEIGTDGLSTAVKAAYAELDGKGYVFKLEVKGYADGLVIMCGVDADGKIAGVKHIESNETYGLEPELNGAYIGKSGSVDKIIASGATPNSATSNGYYTAITAALSAYELITARGGN